MKHLLIFSIALSSASLAFAERGSFRDRTESWLQHENTSTTTGSLRDDGRPELPDGDGPDSPAIPIGSGMACLLTLSAGYFGVKKRKQQAE